jgi:hypothetical protein
VVEPLETMAVALPPIHKVRSWCLAQNLMLDNCEGKKNYKVCKSFNNKAHENLWKAYAWMRRLITMTQGAMKTQVVKFLYGILNKEFRH